MYLVIFPRSIYLCIRLYWTITKIRFHSQEARKHVRKVQALSKRGGLKWCSSREQKMRLFPFLITLSSFRMLFNLLPFTPCMFFLRCSHSQCETVRKEVNKEWLFIPLAPRTITHTLSFNKNLPSNMIRNKTEKITVSLNERKETNEPDLLILLLPTSISQFALFSFHGLSLIASVLLPKMYCETHFENVTHACILRNRYFENVTHTRILRKRYFENVTHTRILRNRYFENVTFVISSWWE